MKKIFSILPLLLMFALIKSNPSEAFIISKVDLMGGEIGTNITKLFKEAQNKNEQIAQQAIVERLGIGYDEFDKWKKQAEKWKDLRKENLVQFLLESSNLLGARNEKVANINKEITRVNSAIKDLKTEIESVKEDVYSEMEAQKSYYESTIASLEANNAVLMGMMDAAQDDISAKNMYQAYIDNNKKQQEDLNKQISELQSKADKQIKGIVNGYEGRIKSLQEKLVNLYQSMAGFMKKDKTIVDAGEALETTQNKFFIAPDEQETPELMEKIRINRLIERRETAIRAYENASKVKIEIKDEEFQAEDAAWHSAGFDTTAATIGADSGVKLKRLEAQLKYANILLAELKMQTAHELSLLNYYKLNKNKDVTQFTLDDYVFNE